MGGARRSSVARARECAPTTVTPGLSLTAPLSGSLSPMSTPILSPQESANPSAPDVPGRRLSGAFSVAIGHTSKSPRRGGVRNTPRAAPGAAPPRFGPRRIKHTARCCLAHRAAMRRRVVSSPSQGNAACGLEPQMQRGEHPTIARVVNGLDLQLELAGRLVNLSEELADALGPHVCAPRSPLRARSAQRRARTAPDTDRGHGR